MSNEPDPKVLEQKIDDLGKSVNEVYQEVKKINGSLRDTRDIARDNSNTLIHHRNEINELKNIHTSLREQKFDKRTRLEVAAFSTGLSLLVASFVLILKQVVF